jgi:hypothetical protein
MKGILIVALGHPNYGKMAAQLAASIKASSNIPIALAYGDGGDRHLNTKDRTFFDQFIEVPKEYYHRAKVMKEYIKVKTHLYQLSPFDETIYLDADMVWLPNKPIDELFTSLNDIDFTIQVRGFCDMVEPKADYSWWVNLVELSKAYNITEGKYYSYSSEFMYFKKKKVISDYFKKAQKNYEGFDIAHTMFDGGIPDELIFGLTTLQTGLNPHLDYFTPIYWEQAEKRGLQGSELMNNYYAYSLGGASQSKKEQKIYDTFVQFYANKMGITNTYKAKNKREYLPQRQRL